jgi:hypothetical protein
MRAIIAGVLVMGLAAMPAAAADTPKEDKMVCKRTEDPYTGSHLSRPKKTCMKASEWKELEDEKDRLVRRAGNNNAATPATPIGGSPR